MRTSDKRIILRKQCFRCVIKIVHVHPRCIRILLIRRNIHNVHSLLMLIFQNIFRFAGVNYAAFLLIQ